MSTDIHTLAGAYALDAVSDIERKQFDRHLAECASCAQEIAELRATVARMADITAVAPPPALKQAVLASASRTRQVPPGGRGADPARRRGWRTWAAGAAAAAVIAVAGGGAGYAISDQNTRSERAVVSAQASESARLARIMGAADADIHVQSMPGGSSVSVVVSRSLNEGVAMLTDMPQVASDQSYQLWLLHGTQAVPAGTMAGGQRGGTVFLTDVRGAGEFGVTVEHAGGAQTPHLPMVADIAI